MMEHRNKTDFELLLFERLHVKALLKIIDIKNKKIDDLASQLEFKVEFGPEPTIDNSLKETNRMKYISSLEARLKYFKERYNKMLKL